MQLRTFISLWEIFLGITVAVYSSERPKDDAPPQTAISAHWKERVEQAHLLATEASADSFAILLRLLTDPHDDVSYAAAEAIEARADKRFSTQLADVIAHLPYEKRWPAYRVAKVYPTKLMLMFLIECLALEMERQKEHTGFDNRNSYYLAGSIESIVEELMAGKTAMPKRSGESREAYARFLVEIRPLAQTTGDGSKRFRLLLEQKAPAEQKVGTVIYDPLDVVTCGAILKSRSFYERHLRVQLIRRDYHGAWEDFWRNTELIPDAEGFALVIVFRSKTEETSSQELVQALEAALNEYYAGKRSPGGASHQFVKAVERVR